MKEKMKREMKRGEKHFFEKCLRTPNLPDELAQNVSKKSLSDKLFLCFFFEGSETDRFFNYFHDSNSIFRAGRTESEKVPGCTVMGDALCAGAAGAMPAPLPWPPS